MKLFMSFLIVVVAMGAMTVIVYGSLSKSYGNLKTMMNDVILLNQIDSNNATMYDHASKFYTMRSDDDLDTAYNILDANEERIASLKSSLTDEDGQKQLDELAGRMTEMRALLDALKQSLSGTKDVEDIRKRLDAIDDYQGDIASRVSFLATQRFELYRLLMIRMNRENSAMFKALLIAALAIAVAASGGALALANGLLKPLVAVAATLGAIADGKGDLTARIDSESHDEIGTLAAAFNRFSASLEGMVLGVRGSAKTLSTMGKTLESGVSENSAAIEEISANVESIGRIILDQSAGVEETQAAAASIVRVVSDLRAKIDQQAAALEKSSDVMNRMIGVVVSVSSAASRMSDTARKLIEASDEGRAKLQAVNDRMKSISSQSAALAEANEVIVGIASQTNLLAMNAAIEAAHAGDSGRGFSVVAEEIRKLAENSSEQAGTTKRELDSIATAIQEAAELEKDAEESFQRIFGEISSIGGLERIVSEALEQEKLQSAEVRTSLGEIDSVTKAVRTGADEVEKVSGAINDAMSELSRITMEIQAGIGEISRGAADINRTMESSKSLSADNAEAIEALRSQMGKFKVDEDREVP
jgi:methyl-accepting chemotaxis protein